MTGSDLSSALAQTIRQTFGGLLDLPLLSPAPSSTPNPAQTLAAYAQKIRFCETCALHIGRQKLVFGRGHWASSVAFLGDFPSAQDDEKGQPFADDSGALLHKMLLAMKLKPEEVYLANIFKCRPPAGVEPQTEHFLACETHLKFQFSQLQAKLVVAMGDFTARALAGSESPLRVLRKQVFSWNGRKVICTHHPRELLQSPEKKKEAWEDLQFAMREMERPV